MYLTLFLSGLYHKMGNSRNFMLNWIYFLPSMVARGLVAEWLCRGLQILVCRFDSDPGLQNKNTGIDRCFLIVV